MENRNLTVDLGTGQATGEQGGTVILQTVQYIEHVQGTAFKDRLFGSDEDNTLVGFAGNDILHGRIGRDVLIGASGNDTLIGGRGADVFVFSDRGGGRDVIRDFNADRDKIDLSDVNDLADFYVDRPFKAFRKGIMEDVDGGVLLRLSEEDTVLLRNLDMADLTASNFIFA